MVRKVYFAIPPTVLGLHGLEVSEKAAPSSRADSSLQGLSLPGEGDFQFEPVSTKGLTPKKVQSPGHLVQLIELAEDASQ